jgi:phosphoglycolate phosphatase
LKLSHADCFIFDFDGTLAPNLDLPEMRRRVVEATLAQGVPSREFEHLYIIEIIDAAAHWLSRVGAAAAQSYATETHQLILDFELDAAAGMDVFPKTRFILSTIRQADRRISIVTRNCEQAVRRVFPDVDDFCDLLLTRDNVEFVKPDPRHLQLALCKLSRQADKSVMIGDSRMDMQLGRKLGLTCVGVLTGSHDAATLSGAGAHIVVDGIEALEPYL